MSVAGQARQAAVALPADRTGTLRMALAVAAICTMPVLLYVPFLLEPLMRDEGLYASVSQWLLDGHVPYRDAFDNKPPLIFGWYSLSFLAFGETVWAPRLVAALCMSATALLVYVQGRLMFSHRGALIAGLAFALSVGIADFQTNANTEYFLLLPMTGALVAFTQGLRTDRWYWFLLGGVLSGLAFMTKQVAMFNFFALVAVVAIAAVHAGGRENLLSSQVRGRIGLLCAGAFASIAVAAAPFFIVGAGDDFIEAVFVYAFGYSNGSPLTTKLIALAGTPHYLLANAGPWVLLAVLGAVWAVRHGRGVEHWMLVLWLGGSAIGTGVTGRFYNHYFVQLLPGMALMAPLAIGFLRDRWDFRWARVMAVGIIPASAFIPIIIALSLYLQPTPEDRHAVKYGFGEGELENTSPALADYVASFTEDGDYIYNLGFQSEIYFYADRMSSTRHLFDHPFAVSERYEREAIEDLRANPPAVVIDSAIYEGETIKGKNYYPGLVKEWVDENYDYIGRYYYADLYVLNQSGAVDD